MASPPSSVRGSWSTFVGRANEIEIVQRWCSEGARLISILGPPGAGKSRLLRRLAALVDEEVVVRDLEVSGGRAGADRLLREVGSEAPWVFVDHADSLANDGAALVGELLRAPRRVLLVASRRRLGVSGETVLRLGPLAEHDAERLWTDRAESAGLYLAWREAQARAPFEAYPLTIERWVTHLASDASAQAGPAAVAAEAPRLRAYVQGLRAEPRLFEALVGCASFLAAFDPSAAAHALPALAHVAELCDRSFVARTRAGHSLFDALREAVRHEARPEELAAAYRGHARALLEGAIGGDDRDAELVTAFERLVTDEPVLAARCLLSSDPHMPTRKVTYAFSERCDELLAVLARTEPRLALRVRFWRGFAQAVTGSKDEARRDLEHVRDAAVEPEDAELRTRALEALAFLAHWVGNLETAAATDENHAAEAVRLRNLGVLHLGTGQIEDARALLEAACDAADGDRGEWAVSRGILAMVHHERGHFLEARRAFDEALRALADVQNTWFSGVVTLWLGLLELDEGRLEASGLRLEEASARLLEVNDRWFSNSTLGYRGVHAHVGGRLDDARTKLERASHVALAADDVYRAATFLSHLGAVWGRLGAASSAAEAIARARAASVRMANPYLRQVVELLATIAAEDREGAARLVSECAASGMAARSSDLRIALRLVARTFALGTERPPPRPRLTVGRDAEWFRAPGGETVSLRRRRSLRLVLARMVDAHREAPGEELSTSDLLEAGWPGERVLFEAGRQRVYVLLAELRKLGLSEWLVHRGAGYLLDPEGAIDVE